MTRRDFIGNALAALGFSALPGKGSFVVEDDGLYVAKGLAIIVR